MGLLDDLRNQSSQLEDVEKKEQERRAQREAIYQSDIMPGLKSLHTHLSELAKHLNYIEPEITVPYIFNADNLEVSLLQHDYNVRIDSNTETKLVTFMFICNHTVEVAFKADDHTSMKNHQAYLDKYNFHYQTRELRNDNREVTGANFTVKPSIPVKFVFEADIDNSCIKLTYTNFDHMGVRTRLFKPEEFNEEIFDQIARYIIRENHTFMDTAISGDALEQIKTRVKKERSQRLEELQEAERIETEELEKKQLEENKRFKLFNKFKIAGRKN